MKSFTYEEQMKIAWMQTTQLMSVAAACSSYHPSDLNKSKITAKEMKEKERQSSLTRTTVSKKFLYYSSILYDGIFDRSSKCPISDMIPPEHIPLFRGFLLACIHF